MLAGSFPAVTTSGQQVSVRPRSVAARASASRTPPHRGLRGRGPDPGSLGSRRRLCCGDNTWSSSSSELCLGLLPRRRSPFRPRGSIRTCAFLSHRDSTRHGRPAGSTYGRGQPGPGRDCSGCHPYRWPLVQIRVTGLQPPSSQAAVRWGHSRVPAAFCWAGRSCSANSQQGPLPAPRARS